MSMLHSVLMGLIQGLTEFLPVSSSGHLALFKILFHVKTDTGILFDVLLHIGTLIAVCLVYYRDIAKLIAEFVLLIRDAVCNFVIFFKRRRGEVLGYYKILCNPYRKFVLLIIVSMIPTGIIGLFAADFVEEASNILFIPGICLIITAVVLFFTDRVPDGTKGPKRATWINALIVGVAQGIATMPGISRSGFTIAAGVFCGFDRKFAVKYSFILSIPSIVGALILELRHLEKVPVTQSMAAGYVVGMIVAAVVGYIAIRIMLAVVRNKKFIYFSIYCLVIGVISVIGYIVM